LPDGLLAFQGASERLTDPAEGAVARFKWADCQFLTKDYAGAISNYWLSVTNAVRSGSPTNSLVTQALYQIVRASIEANDLQSASLAMAEILARDPGGDLADRTELLVGQALNRQGNPLAARNRYLDFVQRFTNSALLPEVKIAIARTYEREHNLDAAIKEYSAWLGSYAGLASVPPPMIAQASFELARLSYQAQPNAPALNLLTNFVSKFPDHTNAPLAQYMIGEYYFGQGDYEKAELHFQDKVLFQNTNALFANLTYHARLMAGRAAVAGQRHRSARDYFDWLITNGPLHVASSPVPVSLVAQAYLFRGDTFLAEGGGGITNSLARFGEAITAFSKVAEHFPTNEFTPIAWGRIGDCHLQLATEDPAQAVTRYQNALAAYRRVVDSTAPVATRSQAEVGLGIVCEKLARLRPAAEQRVLLDEALDRYMRVFHTKNLRGGEQPDPYWVRAGGMAAAELAESQSKWDQAVAVYKRLQTELPSLRERLQKKIDQATKAREASGSAK
jgi:tetratricopeptide (TPR) repeat protein